MYIARHNLQKVIITEQIVSQKVLFGYKNSQMLSSNQLEKVQKLSWQKVINEKVLEFLKSLCKSFFDL